MLIKSSMQLLISNLDHMLLPKALFHFFTDLDGKHFALRNGRGHTWDVTLKLCGEKRKLATLTGECERFVDDNYIKNNYSLVFINNEPFVFDVIIFDEHGVSGTDFLCENKDNKPSEPCFQRNITDTAITRGKIAIPNQFWTDDIVPRGKFREKNVVFVGRGDQRWNVDVKHHSDGRHFFGGCKQMISYLKLGEGAVVQMKLEDLPGLHFVIWNDC